VTDGGDWCDGNCLSRCYNFNRQRLTPASDTVTRRVATLDDFPRIDIRYMRRRGMLEAGESGTLSWSRGEKSVGTVSFKCHADRLILNYQYHESGADWQHETQIVRFDSTPCNSGGERRWFLCPGCSRRVAVLCGAREVFLCRHCHHLPYLSQNESLIRRLIRRKQAIEKRIFEDRGGQCWRKRKGLHAHTFRRGLAQYFKIEQQLNPMFSARLGRIRATMLSR